MAAKPRNAKPRSQDFPVNPAPGLLLESQGFIDPFSPGSWTPPVDICQTKNRVLARIELPGVSAADVTLSFQDGKLRIRGVKRDAALSRKLLCYHCLERRYGKFDRQIEINGVLNPSRSRAHLERGILTIEIPTVKERRGGAVDIPIALK